MDDDDLRDCLHVAFQYTLPCITFCRCSIIAFWLHLPGLRRQTANRAVPPRCPAYFARFGHRAVWRLERRVACQPVLPQRPPHLMPAILPTGTLCARYCRDAVGRFVPGWTPFLRILCLPPRHLPASYHYTCALNCLRRSLRTQQRDRYPLLPFHRCRHAPGSLRRFCRHLTIPTCLPR